MMGRQSLNSEKKGSKRGKGMDRIQGVGSQNLRTESDV
jgi:hypothetical protein